MHALYHDLRYALRKLAKSPGFTFVCVLTIALGIGANTGIFSVMNAVLLRSLPVPDPQQLVYLHLDNQPLGASQTGFGKTSLSLAMYEEMRAHHQVFSDVMAFAPLAFNKVAIRIGGNPEQANGEMVSGNFFSGLGVQLPLGRGFTAEDEKEHSSVTVLNYAFWNRRFARDPQVIGTTLYVKGVPFTVVGVAARGFQGADPQTAMDFWVPLQNNPELGPWGMPSTDSTLYGTPNWYVLILMGRLQSGVTQQQAIAQLTPAFQRAAYLGIKEIDPKEPKPILSFSSARGIDNLRDTYEQPLHLLMGMVGLVLLIACSNVALLLLSRNARRRREFGLRMALGARRSTLFRQLLTESLLLVGTGAFLGWLFALFATQALASWSGLDILISPDRNVLLFTVAIAVLTALVFGIVPLRTAVSVPISTAMKTSAATSNTDRSRFLGRKLVVALQTSLCLVLLVAAGLLFRTLHNLEASNLGIRTDGLLVFGITPQNLKSDAEAVRFHTAMLDRLRNLPGAESATVMQIRFGVRGSNNGGVLVDGQNPLPNQSYAPVRKDPVGPHFLHVLGIPLLLGRDIADSDTASSPKIAIVNQTFVDRYLHGATALGHHISELGETTQYTIVGVAKNFHYTGIREADRPMAFFPFTQVTGISEMQYELHTSGDPESLLPQVAHLVRDIDPNLPLEEPITQRAQFDESISRERLVANLSSFFGLLAALLVAVGLYGMLAYNVGSRTAEIGVRMALGAQRKELLWMVLRESLLLAVVGLAVGIPASFLLARALKSMLYGLPPTDPVTFAIALAGIIIIILAASYLPGRRAASVDPIQALRTE
ncbi:MAG: ABC transporter permease [Acidobacteriaceae bacterium]